MKVHPVFIKGWMGALAVTLAAGYGALPAGAAGHFTINNVPKDAVKTADFQAVSTQVGDISSPSNGVTRLARIHWPWDDDHDAEWHRRHHQYWDSYDRRWYDISDRRRHDRDDYRRDRDDSYRDRDDYRRDRDDSYRDRDDYRRDRDDNYRNRDDYRRDRDDYRR